MSETDILLFNNEDRDCEITSKLILIPLKPEKY